MWCRVVSCRVVSCRVVSCRVVSCRVVSCCVVWMRVDACTFVTRTTVTLFLQCAVAPAHSSPGVPTLCVQCATPHGRDVDAPQRFGALCVCHTPICSMCGVLCICRGCIRCPGHVPWCCRNPLSAHHPHGTLSALLWCRRPWLVVMSCIVHCGCGLCLPSPGHRFDLQEPEWRCVQVPRASF